MPNNNKSIDRFYKKSIVDRDKNLFLRVEALEEAIRAMKAGRPVSVTNIQNIINENQEIIMPSVVGGTSDPTDAAFTGIVISPSGQMIGGVLYNFALVENGVVITGLGDDGSPIIVGGGDVYGPASSVDNRVAVFDGVTGKLLKDGGAEITQDAGNNVAIGTPLSPNIGGDDLYNIAIGDGAIGILADGDNNIAIGRNALTLLNEGASNVAIGGAVLITLDVGNSNVSIGGSSLQALASGDDNTAIGDSALSSLSTGSRNVAIGSASGKYETGSDKFYIDNQDRGDEATGRTASLIYGVFDPDPANQELHLNANVDVNGGFTVNGSPVSGSGLTQAQVMARMS